MIMADDAKDCRPSPHPYHHSAQMTFANLQKIVGIITTSHVNKE
jgi:hypothetical protein